MSQVYAVKVLFREFLKNIHITQQYVKDSCSVLAIDLARELFTDIYKEIARLDCKERTVHHPRIRKLPDVKRVNELIKQAKEILKDLRSGSWLSIEAGDKEIIKKMVSFDYMSLHSGLSENAIAKLFQVGDIQNTTVDNILLIIELFSEEDQRQLFLRRYFASQEMFSLLMTHGERGESGSRYKLNYDDEFCLWECSQKIKFSVDSSMAYFEKLLHSMRDYVMYKEEVVTVDSMDYHEWAISFLEENVKILRVMLTECLLDEQLLDAVDCAESLTMAGYNASEEKEKESGKLLLRCIHENPRIHSCFHEYIGCNHCTG